MTTITRNLGAIATILDNDTLLEAGRRHLAQQHPDTNPQLLTHGYCPNMLLPVNHGERAVINSEGVGHIAEENDTVEVYFTYDNFAVITVALPLTEIANAATDDKIDIADGIRTFGDRLNANHWQWYSRYDKDNA